MGYEPTEMVAAAEAALPVRLIPLCERNYNLVELGPRGTGKSYAVQEVSPYAALLTGPTTVANLFGHMTGKQKGMVQIWDVVGFDEVADLQKMPKEVITTMKTYCESGSSSAGRRRSGDASIAMFGNTNQPIDVMVQTGHLFAPMPDVIRDDMAFIDRCTSTSPAGRCRRCGTSSSPTTTASWSTTWPRRCASCASTTSPSHRPALLARQPPQRPRPQGGAKTVSG
jgi:uncharacterized protein (TIGR02688 family)